MPPPLGANQPFPNPTRCCQTRTTHVLLIVAHCCRLFTVSICWPSLAFSRCSSSLAKHPIALKPFLNPGQNPPLSLSANWIHQTPLGYSVHHSTPTHPLSPTPLSCPCSSLSLSPSGFPSFPFSLLFSTHARIFFFSPSFLLICLPSPGFPLCVFFPSSPRSQRRPLPSFAFCQHPFFPHRRTLDHKHHQSLLCNANNSLWFHVVHDRCRPVFSHALFSRQLNLFFPLNRLPLNSAFSTLSIFLRTFRRSSISR